MKYDNDTQQWEIDLAVELGYDVTPTPACILTMHPFTFEGDTVIARHIVLDGHGRATKWPDGTRVIRSIRHPIPDGFERPC
jgi:hypothetical protein